MPYKDSEKQRTAMRKIMHNYRIRKKAAFEAMKKELEELRKQLAEIVDEAKKEFPET